MPLCVAPTPDTPGIPDAWKALAQEVKARTAILDGELVVADPEGRTVFVSMMQRVAIVPFPGPPWFAMVSPCGRRTLCKCYAHSVCPCHPLWFLLHATHISKRFPQDPLACIGQGVCCTYISFHGRYPFFLFNGRLGHANTRNIPRSSDD
jgi:hypothetical protein